MTVVDYTNLTFHHWGAEQSAEDIIAFIPEDISCVSKVRDFVEAKCNMINSNMIAFDIPLWDLIEYDRI